MLNNIKLGTKLLVISALLVAVPLIVVTYIAINSAGHAVSTVGKTGLSNGAKFIASGLNHSLDQEKVIVSEIAANNAIVSAMEAAQKKGVAGAKQEIAAGDRALKRANKVSLGLGHTEIGYVVTNTKGIVILAVHSDDPGRDFSKSLFFREAMKGKPAFGTVVEDFNHKGENMPIAAPVYGNNGQIIGVLMQQLDLTFVENLVKDATVGKSGYAFVVDQRGMTVAHPDQKYVMHLNVKNTKGLRALATALLSGHSGVMQYVFGGEPKITGYSSVKATGWGVGLTVPTADYYASVTQFRDLAIFVAAVAIVLTLLILFFFVRSITKPLGRAVDYAKAVAAGDFTQRLAVDRRDEVGVLTSTLDEMVDSLGEMITQIRDAAEQTSSSSEEISSSAQQLAEGAQNQASTLEETSASVEELTASVEQVSDHAQNQAASVEESSSNVEQMQRSVQQVSETLGEVSKSAEDSTNAAKNGMESVSQVVEAIKSISTSSEQIAGIVNVISDIADQTNLLALNASIEAARAGEHGRGFAVVADEVSKLADRSASSTKEIEELIKRSSKNVDDGVQIAQSALEAMNGIIGGAQRASELVGALAQDIEQQVNGFKEVAKATESISEMSQSISAATEEQTTNAKQVAKAIENVNELTQSAASAAEEMSSATEELSSLAEQMQRLVEQFKLGEDRADRSLPSPNARSNGHSMGSDGNGHEIKSEYLTDRGRVTSTGAVQNPEAGDEANSEDAEEERGVVLKNRTNGETVHSL